MKKLILFLLLTPFLAIGQDFPNPDYPKGDFISPVHIPLYLAGNYGELRPGHFHEGIDIKTNGVIGYRVYAAADGYVSRIAVSHTGFGNVLYIDHPNGYTTVYGHLNSFNDEIAAYVKEQQYAQEKWNVDLYPEPDQFPVKQNQKIALSGATGGVSGPHVHLEIRDTESEHPLNGLLWGFDITDNIPPIIYRLALYDMNKSIYEQNPKVVMLNGANGAYRPAENTLLVNTDKIGFGVQTLDKQNNTHNIFGVYQGILYDNEVPQNGFQLDDIGYEETRYVDAHYDYKSYITTAKKYQLLFDLPGNELPVYYDFEGNGTIDLSDGKPHPIKIVIKDAHGNASTIKFNIKKGQVTEGSHCEEVMKPDFRNIMEEEHVHFYLEPGTLYDHICFHYEEIPAAQEEYYSDIHRLHFNYVPLYKYFYLRIKPNKDIPEQLKEKLVFVCKSESGKTLGITPAKINSGWVEASVRSFGDYSIQADTQAPTLTPINISDGKDLSGAKDIRFSISDDKSGVKTYRAELDGKWLMFSRKKNIISYTFDEHCPPGNHTLKMTLVDQVGNETIKTYHFKR